ncbi:MAG: diguanylate cyclase [Alphaproteobacteria bacterium]|nr:diguanylate cyclase [Alphaproteobacteria bacterium]
MADAEGREPDRGRGAAPQTGESRTGLSAGDMLTALDDALEEHERWMGRWRRALVCRIAPDADILAPDQHLATEFGRWCASNADAPLLQQPAMRDLQQSYRDAMSLAHLLAERVSDHRPIPVGEYDELMRREDEFRARARRLRDAFRKAVSELDPLTGLSTRTAMMTELEAEFARAPAAARAGSGRRALAIALADIDHFKQINDRLGHAAGDEVLRAAAGRFLSRLRPTDSIYRYGGEEFLICLPDAGQGVARSVLERLRAALADRPIGLESGEEIAVTASFGVATARPGTTLKQVIERADEALYAAKHGGRNRVAGWRGRDGEEDGEDDAEEDASGYDGGDDGG